MRRVRQHARTTHLWPVWCNVRSCGLGSNACSQCIMPSYSLREVRSSWFFGPIGIPIALVFWSEAMKLRGFGI